MSELGSSWKHSRAAAAKVMQVPNGMLLMVNVDDVKQIIFVPCTPEEYLKWREKNP